MANTSGNYKRIAQLLSQWPVEEGKLGRDLGTFLRGKVSTIFRENKPEPDPKHWDVQYMSLRRLLNNEHKNKYPRTLNSSATGLTAEQCRLLLTNESLEELEKEDQPFYKRIFSRNKKQ